MDLASLLAKVQGTMVSSLATPPVPAGSVALISNITNLYNTLLKAGLVSAMGTPTGAGETDKADESKSEPTGVAKALAWKYCKSILSQQVKLPSVGITKYVVNH